MILSLYQDIFNKLVSRKTLEIDLMHQENQPSIAFLGCAPRSGSTLLTRILNSHSKISAPCEIGLPEFFQGDPKEEKIKKKFREICKYYKASYREATLHPEYLFRQILEFEDKESLVIKEPRQSLFLGKAFKYFPGFKLIHLVRDVRSTASSKMFENNFEKGFKIWYEYNTKIQEVSSNLDDKKFIFIRYEDIIEEPEKQIKRLTDFLGYAYEPSMLDYSRFTHADEKMKLWDGESPQKSKWHNSLQEKGISKDVMLSRQQYREELLSIYQAIPEIRELNEKFGYI